LTVLDRGTLPLVDLAYGAVASDSVWDALDWTAAGLVTSWGTPGPATHEYKIGIDQLKGS